MLNLEQQQRALRGLLRGAPVHVSSDPWLSQVAESPGLALLKEIGAWWRRFHIEAHCRYTTLLMKRLGCFECWMDVLFEPSSAPTAIEELTTQFLVSLRIHESPLLRSVAAFESACIAAAGGDRSTAVVSWDRNPDAVMQALDSGHALPATEPGVLYVLRISPGGVSCLRKQNAAAEAPVLIRPDPAESQLYAARPSQRSASASPAGPSGAARIHVRPSQRHAVPPEPRHASAP
jgi:hypothetical protein